MAKPSNILPFSTRSRRAHVRDISSVPEELTLIKRDSLGWKDNRGAAELWWRSLEEANADQLEILLAVAQQVKEERATIKDLFMAYVFSASTGMAGNLEHMRNMRREQRLLKCLSGLRLPSANQDDHRTESRLE